LNARIANIQAEINAIVPSPTPGELVVVDKIIVADQYPAPTLTNIIEPTSILIDDMIGNSSLLQKTQLNFVTLGGNNSTFTPDDLVFNSTSGDSATLNSGSITLETGAGDYTLLNNTTLNLITGTTTSYHNSATLNFTNGTITSTHNSTALRFTNGAITNSLDSSNWTGNIQTVNTVANLTHFLNFSDSAGTGYGRPQKNTSLSCNPSTGLLTATTFSGSLSGNASSASSISLTSDNTAGTYFVPFSKTVSSNSTLFVDNVTSPLTYNPSTGVLTATTFSGSLSGTATTANGILTVSDNTAGTYYIPFSKTTANVNTALFVDDTTTPLTYNPSTSVLTCTTFTGALSGNATTATNCSLATTFTLATFATNTLTIVGSTTTTFLSYNINITGTTNTLSSITYTTPRLNGWYRVGIYNAGTGDLTINSTLGGTATTRTNLSSNLIVPTLRYAFMEIHSFTINALQQYVANIFLLTP
jgi:hypothetical protein